MRVLPFAVAILCASLGAMASAQDTKINACLDAIEFGADINISEPVAACISHALVSCDTSDERLTCFAIYADTLRSRITEILETLPSSVPEDTKDARLFPTWLEDTRNALSSAANCEDLGVGFEAEPCRAVYLFGGTLAAYNAKAISAQAE